jgi:type I site-specific restriction endonuclease
LSVERLELDNNKLNKETKLVREVSERREENFVSIKSTLKEVIEQDNDFCKNAIGNIGIGNGIGNKSTESDADVCDVVKFIVADYVDSKKRHLIDFRSSNEKLKSYQEKKETYKSTILELIKKLRIQNETFKTIKMLESKREKEFENKQKELVKAGEMIQRKDKELVKAEEQIQRKDELIRDLQTKLKSSKTNPDLIQQFKQTESRFTKQISELKAELKRKVDTIKTNEEVIKRKNDTIKTNEEVIKRKNDAIKNLQNAKLKAAETETVKRLKAAETETVKKLKAELQKQEAEYFASLKKYITNLDAMKNQVK